VCGEVEVRSGELMNSLEKRLCEIETKRLELRALCSQTVEEYERALLFQVEEFMKSIKDQLNNAQDDRVIFNQAKDEIEKVVLLEEQIQHIQKILSDFTHHSQNLFHKKESGHIVPKEELDEKIGLGVSKMESAYN
jgi:esterase/lipase